MDEALEAAVEEQWQAWNKKYDPANYDLYSEDVLHDLIVAELIGFSGMDVKEYTLYKKWLDCHIKYPTTTIQTLQGVTTRLQNVSKATVLDEVKAKMWYPEHGPDSYLALEPQLELIDDGMMTSPGCAKSKRTEEWHTLYFMISTAVTGSNIGRNLRYIVTDKVTGKTLGFFCLSSDYLDLTARDDWIGWTREKKTQGGMIGHSTVGSVIVPVQPFGFNYVGGKLLALLCLSDDVQARWEELYSQKLVSVTTTSLYGKTKTGGLSQYDRLKHWKKMGYSKGSVTYEPTKGTQKLMLDWLAVNHPRKFFEWYKAVRPESGQPVKRDHRNRSFSFIYSKLGVPKNLISSAHQRGIYYAPLYDNTREFLRGDISVTDLKKSFPTDVDSLSTLWKERYAAKRIAGLVKNGRVSDGVLYYDDLAFMSWDETKAKYLGDVGR